MTASPSDIYLGFDPGGQSNFGAALLDGDAVASSTVSTVDAAMSWVVERLSGRTPTAAGIDTLLHWSGGRSGDRHAETVLRKLYPDARNTVISPNSLYGSMAVGGMALGFQLRARFPELALNDTHPKLLARHFAGSLPKGAGRRTDERRAWMARKLPNSDVRHANDHEVDAIVSVWATRAAMRSRAKRQNAWRDLAAECSDAITPLVNMHYFWPKWLTGVAVAFPEADVDAEKLLAPARDARVILKLVF